MRFLFLVFLDLATIPSANGDDALYRQAMADHHIKGPITTHGPHRECYRIATQASDLAPLARAYITHNPPPEVTNPKALFSAVGRYRDRAYLQINASDATYCALYRRSGASYRLVREVRLPQ